MDNHYHLVIETPDGNLSRGMRQLNGVYTQAFNRRHCRVGHLFQGRFKGILVQKDSHFVEVCRYVVLNPVRAKQSNTREIGRGAVTGQPPDNPQSPPVSRWKKCSVILGNGGTPAQEKYREYVSEGIGRATIWEDLEAQSLLGLEGFAEALKEHVAGRQKLREVPKAQGLMGRVSLKNLFEESGGGKAKRDRRITEAVYNHGYSQIEVARHLKLHYSTISRLIKSVTKEQG